MEPRHCMHVREVAAEGEIPSGRLRLPLRRIRQPSFPPGELQRLISSGVGGRSLGGFRGERQEAAAVDHGAGPRGGRGVGLRAAHHVPDPRTKTKRFKCLRGPHAVARL